MRNIMLDLETLGVGADAAIMAIGACEFDYSGEISFTFNQPCIPDTRKYSVDASTVRFWLGQGDDARRALLMGNKPLREVLFNLMEWLYEIDSSPYQLWALPASFDIPIIENAFRVEGVTLDGKMPWKYDAGRCARTLFALAGISKADRVQPTVAHDALEDAIAQAKTVAVAMKKLGLA